MTYRLGVDGYSFAAAVREEWSLEPISDGCADFGRERGRILRSDALRVAGGKTQLVSGSRGRGTHTRLSHTLLVAGWADELAACTGTDCDLVGCIALGHDLGHPPFAHAGERGVVAALRETGLEQPYGPSPHHTWSVSLLRGEFALTSGAAAIAAEPSAQVADGIRDPSLSNRHVREAQVVGCVDAIVAAYHDLRDLAALGLAYPHSLDAIKHWLGADEALAMCTLVERVVASSDAGGRISLDLETATQLDQLREDWMVFRSECTAIRERDDAAEVLVRALVIEMIERRQGAFPETDLLSLVALTDDEALRRAGELGLEARAVAVLTRDL